MITNKFAIICAEILREYCDQNFCVDDKGFCQNCIFGRKKRPSGMVLASPCHLEAFITGRYGKLHQKDITEQVENRLKELKNGNQDSDL